MKKNGILLSLLFICVNVLGLFAQNEECAQNLSIFAESAKVKNYDGAYTPWKLVRTECPKLNVAVYSYGEKILKHKIKKAATDEEKKGYIEDLMVLYSDWITNFPTKKGKSKVGSILSNKGQAMIDFKLGTPKERYDVFDEAFTKDAKSFINPKNLYGYFKSYYDAYKGGKDGVTTEMLFNKYEEISEKFELESANLAKKLDVILKKEEEGTALTSKEQKRKKRYNTNSKAIGIFTSNLEAIISGEASCDNLIPLYKRNFEENKGNEVWLKRAANRMNSKECSDDPFFITLVEALHNTKPSADSAYYLGILKDKQGDSKGALAYYEESITLEEDSYQKAKILYKIAKEFKKKGRKSLARSYARKALKQQPSLGKAYLLIASLYASSANDCGNTQFEKRAVYWLAEKTAKRAGQVDASLLKTSKKTAKSYLARAPSKTDVFTEGNEGQEIKFNCWISSSIVVPKL